MTTSAICTNQPITLATTGQGQSTLYLAGTLQKWTNYVSQWQWRYVICKEGKLKYYKSKNDQHLGIRGELHLAFATVAASFYHPLRFTIKVDKVNAEWCFDSQTELERDKWVSVIKANIEWVLNMHQHIHTNPTVFDDNQDAEEKIVYEKSEQ